MSSEIVSHVFADVVNLCTHLFHPTSASHPSSCLICSVSEHPLEERFANINAKRMLSLLPLATPSDLDLAKTGSTAIRQIVISGQTSCMHVVHFCKELKTHLGYNVQFGTPTQLELQVYQVLVFIVCDYTLESKTWFDQAFAHCAQRVVVICPESLFQAFTDIRSSKLTVLGYKENLRSCVDTLLHASMVTKHRLMPKDLQRFSQTLLLHAPQPGMCLFF
jgi:hypothetical protein